MRAIIPAWEENLRQIREEESLLETKIRRYGENYSGLKDVEDILSLSVLRFSTALMLLDHLDKAASTEREGLNRAMGEEVKGGKELLDMLLGENLAQGEGEAIKGRPRYKEAQELFKKILLAGGAGFFDQVELSKQHRRMVCRTVAGALKKYARPDDNPSVLFVSENLPVPLQRFLKLFFPTAAPENMKPPPYGIPEGQEEMRNNPYLVMPLSQGIFYLEEELLPQTEKGLQENPGDPELQEKRRWIQDTLARWNRLSFIPRATPVLLNQDFYTQGLSQYTPEGEPLVRFALPVRYSSGTDLDRYGEQVRGEVVRRLAGRGIIPALDEDLQYRRSLKSGRRGNSRTPSFRLNLAEGFRALKGDIPALGILEDKAALEDLLTEAQRRSVKTLARSVKTLLKRSEKTKKDRRLT